MPQLAPEAESYTRVASALRAAIDKAPELAGVTPQWRAGFLDGLLFSACVLETLAQGGDSTDALTQTFATISSQVIWRFDLTARGLPGDA